MFLQSCSFLSPVQAGGGRREDFVIVGSDAYVCHQLEHPFRLLPLDLRLEGNTGTAEEPRGFPRLRAPPGEESCRKRGARLSRSSFAPVRCSHPPAGLPAHEVLRPPAAVHPSPTSSHLRRYVPPPPAPRNLRCPTHLLTPRPPAAEL